MIENGSYIIHPWMCTRLNLSGNELLVYAVINSFSRDGKGTYYGGVDYLCSVCGASKPTIIKALKSLLENGLIIQQENEINAHKCYSVTEIQSKESLPEETETEVKNLNSQGKESLPEEVKNLNFQGKESLPHIINNNKNNNKIINKRERGEKSPLADKPPRFRFIPPTVEEVEKYCAERKNGINAEAFIDFYSAKGWKVGKNEMKDWKAAVRTWEHRESSTTNYRPAQQAQRRDEMISFLDEELAKCGEGM